MGIEQFIEKAQQVHTYKYNYLEFNYKQLKYMTKEQFEELVITNINRRKQ